MKAERRHELQENELGHELQSLLTFFKNHGNKIGWVLLVIALIGLVWSFVGRRSQEKAADLQASFDKAIYDPSLTPEQQIDMLNALVVQGQDRQKAAAACLKMGEIYATRLLQTSRDADPTAWDKLAEEASNRYQKVLNEFGKETVMVAQARIGLAKIAENRRDFATARQQYETVAKDAALAGFPVQMLAEAYLQSLAELETPVPMATTAPAVEEDAPAAAPAE